jgi:hypothetical protein
LRDRLVTFALALGALALFYILLFPKPAAPDGAAALPVSTETAASGYQAAWRWLAHEQVPVVSWRERYYGLGAPDASRPETGNILLTTLPHRLPSGALEAGRLDAWVERGNTLVVLAALDDTPAWALLYDRKLLEAVSRLTRLKFTAAAGEERKPSADSSHPVSSLLNAATSTPGSIITPVSAHPLFDGVRSVQVFSDFPASRWRATSMDQAAVLPIGQVQETGDAAIWLRKQGNGQVITFAVASVFSNQAIGERDNAQLLSNLVAWSRGPGGAVMFDDAHQGLVDYYDAKAFFADPRLHRTLAWIVLLWFVFVLGLQRLPPRIASWNPTDVTAFVAITGDFFAATLPPSAAGARLLVNFFNSIHRRLGQDEDGSPEWHWLSKQAGIPPDMLSELRRAYARIQAAQRVDLVRLQNLLSQVRGNLI